MAAIKIWTGIQDEKTCPTCTHLIGEIRPLTEPFSNGKNTPPAHPNCRCTVEVDYSKDR